MMNFQNQNISGMSLKEAYLMSQAENEIQVYGKSKTLDRIQRTFGEVQIGDSAAGFYAATALDILDLTLHRPMYSTHLFKHVPVRYGGGVAEKAVAFRQQLQTARGRLIGGATNEVHIVNSNHERIEVPIYPIQMATEVYNIDLMKAQVVAYDILGASYDAIRLSYLRELDRLGFIGTKGVEGTFYPGLLNIDEDTNKLALEYGGKLNLETQTTYNLGGKKLIEELNLSEQVTLFVQEIQAQKIRVAFDSEHYINKVLFYPELYATFLQPVTLPDGTQFPFGVLEYIEKQVEKLVGFKVAFDELPYLSINSDVEKTFGFSVKGTNNKGRIVMYRQNEKSGRLNLAMDLTQGATMYDPRSSSWLTSFMAFASPYQAVYPLHIRYIDNGTTAAS